MTVTNVMAGIAVKNLDTAAAWYEALIGTAGTRPMSNLAEWSLPRGGVLQVFKDDERAGRSSITLSVTGLDEHVERLAARGVKIGNRTQSEDVSTAAVQDPEGNQVVLAEPHSDKVAR